MKFPSLQGCDLNGRDLEIPQSLSGRPRLVILAFERAQSALIATWHGPIRKLSRRFPTLRHWEIAVLSSSCRLWRPFIDNGMRAGTPDPEARSRTITVYTDRSELIGKLGISSFGTIVLLLLDEEGEVLWQHEGEFAEDALASLLEALTAYTAYQPRNG